MSLLLKMHLKSLPQMHSARIISATSPFHRRHISTSQKPLSLSSLSLSSHSLSSKFQWHTCNYPKHEGPIGNNKTDPTVTVVVMGWLGASPRHLRKYVEMYNARGFHAVTFVASVGDVLSFDLGRGLEERVAQMARSLAAWAEEGRERELVFHTFSNTGWLA